MKIKDPSWYRGREQTYVKHFVLANYLERLAHIVGPRFGWLTYVDAFAGPWQSKDDNLEDTSPRIAIEVLREARDAIRIRGGNTAIRAMFIEQNQRGVETLSATLGSTTDIELRIVQGEFEDLVPEAVKFARKSDSFCFTFIDPCGWTGMDLAEIKPLLQVQPGEVLVNFMTDHINRFLDHPEPKLVAQFEGLFGTMESRDQLVGLAGEARQEAMVAMYCRRLRDAGRFRHVVSAVVANPLKDRAYFHLIYATRHDKGLQVFRDTERRALGEQASVRAQAQQHKREARGQRELFRSAEYVGSDYISELRDRNRLRAQAVISAVTPIGQHVLYKEVAVAAMQTPMIAEQDVKEILKQQRGTFLRFTAKQPHGAGFSDMGSTRVPRWGEQHFVCRMREAP